MSAISKTAKASMKQADEPIRKRQPGEHNHVCPACGTLFTHISPRCQQLGLAYSPCDTPGDDRLCIAWFERPVSVQRIRPTRKEHQCLASAN